MKRAGIGQAGHRVIETLEERVLCIIGDDGGGPIGGGGGPSLDTSALFHAPAVYSARGQGTQGVCWGDFNRDGKPDVAFTNAGSGTIGVMLNKGDGTFNKAAVYPNSGANLSSIQTIDFNGDRILDLAWCGDDLAYALGKGDGSFGAATHIATGNTVQNVALADYNGDNRYDIAVTNVFSNTVSVLLNRGKGRFFGKIDSPAGNGPCGLAFGDFSGDHVLDLAVTDLGQLGTGVKPGVRVLVGNGAGSFTPGKLMRIGGRPVSVAAGDLNRDGVLDLVVARGGFGNPDGQNAISVFRGAGNASFTIATYATGAVPEGVLIADVDRDRRPDIVVGNYADSSLSVFKGDGSGVFNLLETISGAPGNANMIASDFNLDGRVDLAVPGFNNGSMSVLLHL
jgi:hypothetical protein